jgi:hypothetical protein
MIASQEKAPASGGLVGRKNHERAPLEERKASITPCAIGDALSFPADPLPELQGKVFSTLQARYALLGHALHRTVANDGSATLWVERWGQVRFLPTMADAKEFLRQVEGA